MKIQVVKLDEVMDIICDYYNQTGETLSLNAREFLEEQINMCSFEVELDDPNTLEEKHKQALETLDKLKEKFSKNQ